MNTSHFYVLASDACDNVHTQFLRFIGAIDKTNVDIVKKYIADSINPSTLHVNIDFEKMTFISTTALSVIVRISKVIINRNGSLTLSKLDDYFIELFNLSGIGRLFDIFPGTDGYTAMLSLERCRSYLEEYQDVMIHSTSGV